MRDIECLLPRIFEVVPACPEPTAIRHLRDAAIDFCRRTRIWRENDCYTVEDDDTGDIAVISQAQIYEITSASVTVPDDDDDDDTDPSGATYTLTPKTVDWLDKNRPGWRWLEDSCGTPEFVTQTEPNMVRIFPLPEIGSRVRLQLILLPSITTDQIIDVLVDAYSQVIADGALARILALPGDFTNPSLAAVYASSFGEALDRWGSQVPRGQMRARRSTKTPSFF